MSMCSGDKFKSRFLLFGVSTARPRFPSDPRIFRALTCLTISAAAIVIAGHFEPAQGNPSGITNIFQPLSQPAQEIREVSLLVIAICATIFLIVAGLLVYTIVRYRHRAGDEASEPPQIYGSNQIELAWTVLPILIVFVFILVTSR